MRLTLREARLSRKLTQVELADRADMQQSDLSAIENGHNKQPRPDTMQKLASALGMDALFSPVAGLVFEEKSQ